VRFRSTRGAAPVSLEAALVAGLAPDGGLFVPEALPSLSPVDFDGLDALPAIGERLLAPFFAGSALHRELGRSGREAFDFPVTLDALSGPPDPLSVLELFHGPTAAFKDFGARFLAACMQRLDLQRDDRRALTIMVATSGDTGGAVAAAFHGRPGFRVVILYPAGQVSPRQAHQLSCWGGNVLTLEVDGPFDCCQALVKEAFASPLAGSYRLCSANSINIGRLLPQMVYYAATSLWLWRRHGEPVSFVIPTGNLGNAHAAVLAREIGLPIGAIHLATNANRTVPDYLRSGEYRPRESLATLASAMDVGAPSNMERLRALFPQLEVLRARVSAVSVSDEAIRAQIRQDHERLGRTWCPHTATAAWAWERLPESRRRGPWVLVATAHPAKFDTVVEPLIGARVPVPPALEALLSRPARRTRVGAEPAALAGAMAAWSRSPAPED